jgi:hypothetical protein
MDRVCLIRSTGRLAPDGYQSGGKVDRLAQDAFKTAEEYTAYTASCDELEAMRLDTLKQNAINAGYAESDIEVRWVTQEEYAALTAPTAEEAAAMMKKQAIDAIQGILDAQAKALGFDSIHTAAVWTISKNPARKARADALVAWGDTVWDFAEAEWEKQAEGKGTYLAVEAFLAALPKFPGVTA